MLSISGIIQMFYSVYGKTFARNVLRNGEMETRSLWQCARSHRHVCPTVHSQEQNGRIPPSLSLTPPPPLPPLSSPPPPPPDLGPCDFFMCPKIKFKPREYIFNDVLEIQQHSQQLLNGLTKEFQTCCQQWQNRWSRLSPINFRGE